MNDPVSIIGLLNESNSILEWILGLLFVQVAIFGRLALKTHTRLTVLETVQASKGCVPGNSKHVG